MEPTTTPAATTGISLQKGQKVDLTKTNPGVTKYRVGLGWNPNAAVVASGKPFDLDVSAFVLGENKKLLGEKNFVFYNNLKSPTEAVVHTGDNRDGQGEGDDESLLIDFSKIEATAKEIIFVVTIHEAAERNQNFGQVGGAFIRIANETENKELMKYDLNEDYSIETAMTFGRLYLKDGEWKFEAVGSGTPGGLPKYLTDFQ